MHTKSKKSVSKIAIQLSRAAGGTGSASSASGNARSAQTVTNISTSPTTTTTTTTFTPASNLDQLAPSDAAAATTTSAASPSPARSSQRSAFIRQTSANRSPSRDSYRSSNDEPGLSSEPGSPTTFRRLSLSASDQGHTPSATSDSSQSSNSYDTDSLSHSLYRNTGFTSREAHNRFCRARKQVRSMMLITSSMLEGSGIEEDEGDEGAASSPFSPRTPASLIKPESATSMAKENQLPLPRRAHARFRAAFRSMRQQMLITSRIVETGSCDRFGVGDFVVRPRSPFAGKTDVPAHPYSTSPSINKATQQRPAQSPHRTSPRVRCLSVANARQDQSDLEDSEDDSQGSIERARRKSLSGFSQLGLRLRDSGIQAGIRTSRPSAVDPACTLELHLRAELRKLQGQQSQEGAATTTATTLVNADSDAASVQNLVHAYMHKIPPTLTTTEGWTLCMQALFESNSLARGAAKDADLGTAEPSVAGVLDVFDQMSASNVKPSTQTYATLIRTLCILAGKAGSAERGAPEAPRTSYLQAPTGLLKRALSSLRLAVDSSAHSPSQTNNDLPFMDLLDGLGNYQLPEQAKEVLDLWSQHASRCGSPQLERRAFHIVIHVVAAAAEREAATNGSASPTMQTTVIAPIAAAQTICHVVQLFEQAFRGGLLLPSTSKTGENPQSEVQRASDDLAIYNAAIEALFRLGYPDRGMEIFERILSHQQPASAKFVPSVPIDASTISVILVGLLRTDEPVTAVKWMLKLRQHNELVRLAESGARTSKVEAGAGSATQPSRLLPEPSDAIVAQILEALVRTISAAGEAPVLDSTLISSVSPVPPPPVPSSSQASSQALLDLLPIIRERAGISTELLTPELASRVGDAMRVGPRTVEQLPGQPLRPTHVQQGNSQPLARPSGPPELPEEMALSVIRTPKSSGGSYVTAVSRHGSPIASTSSLDMTIDTTRSHNYGLDPSLLIPLNAAPTRIPPVRRIDVEATRRLESMLKVKRAPHGKNSGTGGAVSASAIQNAMRTVRKGAMNGVLPSPAAMQELIAACGRVKDVSQLREVYTFAMAAVGLMPPRSGEQTQAWYSIEDAVMSAFAHSEDATSANAHRRRLLEAGLPPSANSYAALIATVKDTTDDAQAARELWLESRRLGVVPNIYLYNAIISKLSRARKAYPALQLFEEMRKPPHNLQPSSVTYGAIVNACVRGGDRARAIKYFAEMEADASFRPRVPPYNCMIQFFTYAEPDREQALLYYEKMVAVGVQPSEHTYKLLLDIFGTIKPVLASEMEGVFQKLSNDSAVSVNGAHWASLIQCYGIELGDVTKAIEVFNRSGLSEAHSDPVALEALMLVFFEARRPDLMRHYAQVVRTRMTAYIGNLLIKGYALNEIGDLAEARNVFQQMQDPPVGKAAMGNHAPRVHGMKTSPSPAQAEETQGRKTSNSTSIRSMSAAAFASKGARHKNAASATTPGLEPNVVHREPSTYESMIRAELHHGQVEQARRVFSLMETRGFPLALTSRTRTLFDEPRDVVLTMSLKPSARDSAAH